MDMYNLNQVSKKTIANNVRLEKQQDNFLKESYKKAKAEAEAKEAAINEAALSSARFGYAATLQRGKDRVRALEEEIKYTNTSSLIAMTEMLSQVVEKSLLLDEEEYAKLNPSYKDEIRETVRGLLENGDLKTTQNSDTLAIMEYVSKKLPNVQDGKYLTEDELSSLFNTGTPADIEQSINNLAGNVSHRVATLVEKEQKKVNKVQQDLDQATPAPEAAAPAEDAPVEDAPVEDPNAQLPSEEQPVDPAAQEEVPSEPVADQNGQTPVQAGKQIHIAPDGSTSIAMPNGQLALNQDGSMDIQLAESFVRETPRSGLLESLAVNAAMNMLENGETYNADKAIANAILYMTITEAMGESGLMNVDDKTYSNIIVNAGGSLCESKKGDKLRLKATKLEFKAKELKNKAAQIDAKKDKKVEPAPAPQEPVLQESFMYQWKPTQQNASSDDLAERIRKKRMLKEQNRNLNE